MKACATNIAGSEATVRTPDRMPNQSKCFDTTVWPACFSYPSNVFNMLTKRMYGERDPAANPIKTTEIRIKVY